MVMYMCVRDISQESEQVMYMCVRGISQESERSCICEVWGKARKVSSHV
jgi:hypothetical protein